MSQPYTEQKGDTRSRKQFAPGLEYSLKSIRQPWMNDAAE